MAASNGAVVAVPATGSNVTLTTDDAAKFVSDSGSYRGTLNGGGNVQLASVPHSHCIYGEASCTATTKHSNFSTTKELWMDLNGNLWTGNTVLTVSTKGSYSSNKYYELAAGSSVVSYYLSGDLELDYPIYITKGTVSLCLNGHELKLAPVGTNNSASGVITLDYTYYDSGNSSGGSAILNLTDCKPDGKVGTVTHSNDGEGYGVELSNGAFIMYGGSITGNTATNNGGVYVSGGGTFNMLGGEITGNTAAGSGGVYVSNGIGSIGKFTMSGGEISGNTADSYGGGVYVTPYNSTFTMSGDVTITGNKVCVAGNNVYLPSNKTITIGAALGTGAKIGVITSGDPTSGNPIQIATDATNEQLDYTKIFTPDVKDKGYTITKDGATLYLSTHEHSWEYSVGADDVTTISATCKDTTCTSRNGGMVTISKPRHTVYGDGKTADATVAKSTWVADAVSEITYKNYTGDNTPLPAAPTDAGRYIASITAGGKTAYVFYEIAKATPTANDFNFSVPTSNLTYDGTAKTATVEPKEGITGMGTAIGITYYKDTDSTIRNRQS